MNQEKSGRFALFIKQFKTLHSNRFVTDSYLKIVSSSEGADNLLIQIVGKNVFFKSSVSDLLRSDMLMSFSKADIAVITYMGAKKELEQQQADAKPKLLARIAQQLFGKSGKTKFLLKMPEQDQLVEAVPEEVMMNHEALDMLSGKDAAILGYAAAENRQMEIRKQASQTPTCHIIEHNLIDNIIVYIDEEREAKHTLPLTEIFNNKKLLSLFNKADQQMISFAAGEAHQQRTAKNKPIFSIISQSNETLIYRDIENEEHEASLLDIAFNDELLFSFSQRDQHLIRFVAGELHAKSIATKQQPSLKILSRQDNQIEYIDPEGSAHSTTVEALAFNRDLIEQFSILDREQISYAAGEAYQKRLTQKQMPTLCILSQTNNKLVYRNDTGEEFETSFMDLAFSEDLLLQFSVRDQHLIRFVAGELHAKNTARTLATLKIVHQSDDLVVYVNQENVEASMPITQLVFNRELLEQFSIEEREKLVFAAGEYYQKELSPARPVTLALASYLGETAYFKDFNGNTRSMSFTELAFESDLLNQFNQKDRDMIRFAAGEFSNQGKKKYEKTKW